MCYMWEYFLTVADILADPHRLDGVIVDRRCQTVLQNIRWADPRAMSQHIAHRVIQCHVQQ